MEETITQIFLRVSRLEEKLDKLEETLEEIYSLVKHIQLRIDNQTTRYYPGH